MSVHFKFRSSVAFDSADLGGRPTISVRDLRAKIVAQKNLQICRDFDLVISDAGTGQAFDDEEFQIPEGSSVIIKRVPASLVASGAGRSSAGRHVDFITTPASSPSENVDMENFDDFGIDLYPTLEASLPESDADVCNMTTITNKKDDFVPRCSETHISRCQNFERSDLSEAMLKGIKEKCKKGCDKVENKKQTNLQPKEKEHKKLDEAVGMSALAMSNTSLPMELRCALCCTIFKEAVVIPFCQHSFCDKCIRLALVERARCPKCSSLKCTVEDLLPNLSLRQAIEHFLEAQMAINGTDNIIPKYASDGESGIQAKEVSCAVSIQQQDSAFPRSLSATGKGSNQVMTESAYENKGNAGIGSHLIRLDVDTSVKSSPSSLKIKQLKGNENNSAEALKQMADFQAGGGSSKLSQNLLQKEEANLTIQKNKVPGVNPSDGSGVLMPPFKHRKGDRTCYMCGSPNHWFRDCPAASNTYPVPGDRTCYMCGSPNHLFRDCPAASNTYPVLLTGDAEFPGGMSPYGQAYWHGATIPHVRPCANIYGAPGMMPFDPKIVPVTPLGVPSYMPSLYSGMPVPYGFMRMGGVPPSMMAGTKCPLTHAEFMDLQDGEWKHKLLNEHPDRELGYDNISEDYHYNGTRRRSHDQGHHVDKETTRSCSDYDSQRIFKKQSRGRHYSPSRRRPDFTSDAEIHSVDGKHEKRSYLSVSGRDQRTYYYEKSNSEVQDLSDSSDRRSREKSRRYKGCSEEHIERRGHCGSDCSRKSHYQSRKEESDDMEKVVKDHNRQSRKHHYHLESGFEPDSSNDRRQLPKEKESSQSSRHSGQKVKSTNDQLDDVRWEGVGGLDNDYSEEYYSRKCKRTR